MTDLTKITTKGLKEGEDWRDYAKPECWHPAAASYPRASKDESERLRMSIRKLKRVRKAIMLLDGKIIDGINRILACKADNIEPWFQVAKLAPGETPQEYVATANLDRAHYTKAQQALLVARDILPKFEAEAAERQKAKLKHQNSQSTHQSRGPLVTGTSSGNDDGEAAILASKKAGVNEKYLRRAKRILVEDPELAEKILAGDVVTLPPLPSKKPAKKRKRGHPSSIPNPTATEAFRDAWFAIDRCLRLKPEQVGVGTVADDLVLRWKEHGPDMIRHFANRLIHLGVWKLKGMTLEETPLREKERKEKD